MTDQQDAVVQSAPKAAPATPTAIPGYDVLGCGFNIFDAGASELAQSAFRGALVQFQGPNGDDFMGLTAPYQKDQGGRWTVPANPNQGGTEPLQGSVYQVPADVEIRYIGETTTSNSTCYTYQQIANYFSTQAGLAGGDGEFWGSANSTFSSSTLDSSSYFYGLFETFVQRWAVAIDNPLLNVPQTAFGSIWDTSFCEDAAGLAGPFDPTNPKVVSGYQAFFSRYGTHVIAAVTVGARSRISVCIKRSSNISESDATLDVKAEYDGVTGNFGSKTSYKNSNYVDNRSSQFLAIGGDQQLATLASSAPASLSEAGGGETNFQKWLASTDEDPSPILITLVGLWNLAVFDAKVQTALKAAYDYFALPNSVLPFYCYLGSNDGDYLYTTLENPEGSETHMHFGSYKAEGAPFYVLPQTSTAPAAVVLRRYYNSKLHFYTTDTTKDSEILANGKYQEDSNYYSKVLPLDASGAETSALATIYRFELQPSDGGNGHWFSTSASDTPARYLASDGSQFLAFANAPADPFSRSSLALAAQSAPRASQATPSPSPAGVSPAAVPGGNITIRFIHNAQHQVAGNAALMQAVDLAVQNNPDLKQYANRYKGANGLGVVMGQNYQNYATAWLTVDTDVAYTEGLLRRTTYYKATGVAVYNLT